MILTLFKTILVKCKIRNHKYKNFIELLNLGKIKILPVYLPYKIVPNRA